MNVRSFSGAVLLVAAVAAALLCAPSCGKSPLSNAYDSYKAKIEKPLLDRDIPLWKKVAELFNEQRDPSTSNPQKFEDCLRKEAVPFYDEFAAQVHAITPDDPGLAEAHEALTKYADARASFVHYLTDNLEVLRPDASAEALDQRTDAANAAVEEYEKLTEGPTAVQDPRFIELRAVKDDFTRFMGQFAQGKSTQQDLQDSIRKNILPRVQKLRSGKFADDATGRALSEAIGTWEDFFAAMAANLPYINRNARFGDDVMRRTKEADELYQRFRDAMAAVRRRM